MLNHVIAFSLRNRTLVLALAVALSIYGTYVALRLPVDVFPDLNRPTVAVMTEAPGLAPEEVEVLVTRPLEALLNGATGVERVRSSSGIGLSIVWVEFGWGTDIYIDRQVVAEKLQLARDRLPHNANPVLAPISSIMGEIMLVGLRSTTGATSPLELRTLADWTVRQRLLAVEGVSQVAVLGGVLKQYQILTSPQRLAEQNVTLAQLVEAAEKASAVTGGGFLLDPARESLIRISGRGLTLDEIGETPVVWRQPRPVRIRDVADVRFGGPVPRGDGSLWVKDPAPPGGPAPEPNGGPAVILSIQKQPHANTLVLDAQLGRVLDHLQAEMPPDVVLEQRIFKQADFIRAAIDNVTEAIRDGAIWVVVILFLFLVNFRTSLITLTALPLSVLLTALVFQAWGVSLNTMTLGGIAVAVGELVDDAIVDVENIYRRLKENRARPCPDHPLRVIFLASSEVRSSIVYATLIVCLVVVPLLGLGGLEGRMFAPLGIAYIVALAASLVVSLTVTPALASFLLPRARFLERPGDPFLLRGLKWLDTRLLRFTLRHPRPILAGVLVCAGLALVAVFGMGGEFLPDFHEGTLTINLLAEPGTSLAESNRLGQQVETMLLQVPEVVSVARRTGRAELDEHAEGVNASEIDVRLIDPKRPRPGWLAALVRTVPGLHQLGVEANGRPRDDVLVDIRDRVSSLPGVRVNIGQPISHRLDHITSGVQAQVAIKLFGPDGQTLAQLAQDAQSRLRAVPGVVDIQVRPEGVLPQVRVEVKRREAAEQGLAPGDVARLLETAYRGRVVAEVQDEERRFDLVVWYDEASRNDLSVIGSTILDTPSGRKVALEQVADVHDTVGPETLLREDVQRVNIVACNVEGRDLAGAVADIQAALAPVEAEMRTLPGSYRMEYGGQFESQQQANRRLLLLGGLALAGVFFLLMACLESWRAALQVLMNVPLAAIGSVAALLLVNHPAPEALAAAPWWRWPQVWLGATTLSVAHWVGFITLTGVVSRNGILMISHYLHLMRHEGEPFGEAMIIRGSLERLAPVLMTASCTVIALVPLALGAGQTGKEILHPLAIVVIGGLLSSTLLDQVVTPALFLLFGRHAFTGLEGSNQEEEATTRLANSLVRNGASAAPRSEPVLPSAEASR